MAAVVMGVYHAMAVYIIGILLWLFIRERKSWQKAVLCLVAAVPLVVRILRIR